MQPYDKFIVLSEEQKERISKMSEYQLDMVACFIANNMRKAQMEIEKEVNENKSS